MNYYSRHLGDYAGSTAHLSMLEHGAYNLLLDRYYKSEQGIPEAEKYRLTRARSRQEKSAVDSVLNEFFNLSDGIWTSFRVAEEIEKARAKIGAARVNGLLGGRPKSGDGSKPNRFCGGSKPTAQAKATHLPNTKSHNPESSDYMSDREEDKGDDSARRKALSERLQSLGISASCDLPAWVELLSNYRDDQIISAAQKARNSKAGSKLHLNYLVPMLRSHSAGFAVSMSHDAARRAAVCTNLSDYLNEDGSAKCVEL